MNKTNLGTIYQYNSKEGYDETLIYTNTEIYRNDYVRVEIQYRYADKKRDIKEIQERMIDYY